MREITPGELFGHEELIEEYEQSKKNEESEEVQAPIVRHSRVRALVLSDLIYLNKKDFFECITHYLTEY